MLEVAPSGEEHRHAVAIGRVDHHLIAHRPARLDDGGHAGPGRDLDAVREREVRIRRHDREPRVLAGLAHGDLHRDHARQLSRSDADAHEILREHDPVRSDVPHAAPGEDEVGELLERRMTVGHDLEVRFVGDGFVGRLHEHAAGHALVIEQRVAPTAAKRRRPPLDGQDLEVLALLEDRQCVLGVAGRDDRLIERVLQRVGQLARHRPVH